MLSVLKKIFVKTNSESLEKIYVKQIEKNIKELSILIIEGEEVLQSFKEQNEAFLSYKIYVEKLKEIKHIVENVYEKIKK